MNDFYKNKIKFKLESPRKANNLVVIPFFDKKYIPNKVGFKFLNKEFQGFIKKSLNTSLSLDNEILNTQWGEVFFVKHDKVVSLKNFVLLSRRILKTLKDKKRTNFLIYLDDLPQIGNWRCDVENEKDGWEVEYHQNNLSLEEVAEIFVSNFVMADFDFSRLYKKTPKDGWNEIKDIFLFGNKNLDKSIKSGILIGEETNRARFLSNLPGGDLTPSQFVEFAKDVAKESNLNIKVLGENELKKIGAGGILGVAKGSKEKPYLIILQNKIIKIQNPKSKNFNLCLIGKGITFDSGGLHIKNSGGMDDMFMDMSGAASVLSAMSLISKLKINENITAVIPVCENMPSGESFRPGDILKTISSKTIEVGSPDAEGRIIIADAIDYAKKFLKPDLIVELSTLTGASGIALGTKAAAIFSTDEKLESILKNIGEISGDYVWSLPLWDEYKDDIKSDFADVCNIGKSRYGGAIHGAIFLKEFVEKIPFIHLDIAPRMIASSEEFLNKGSAGFGVRFLKELALILNKIQNVLK